MAVVAVVGVILVAIGCGMYNVNADRNARQVVMVSVVEHCSGQSDRAQCIKDMNTVLNDRDQLKMYIINRCKPFNTVDTNCVQELSRSLLSGD